VSTPHAQGWSGGALVVVVVVAVVVIVVTPGVVHEARIRKREQRDKT
jgi:uncharacterized protein (DUF2062 family)